MVSRLTVVFLLVANGYVQISFCKFRAISAHFALKRQTPYQAWILKPDNKNYGCSGILYDSNTLITTASCVSYTSPKDLRFGFNMKTFSKPYIWKNASSFLIHPYYKQSTGDNNIALVHLNRPKFGPKNLRMVRRSSINGTQMTVTGWGPPYSREHRLTNPYAETLNVLSRRECMLPKYGYGDEILPSMICGIAKKYHECKFEKDPLMLKDQLVGLAVSRKNNGSGDISYPCVFVNIVYFRRWIMIAARYLNFLNLNIYNQ